jgi:hypothetical protein
MELTIEEVAQLLGAKDLEIFQLRKRVAELESFLPQDGYEDLDVQSPMEN